jgi:hypothetical protein
MKKLGLNGSVTFQWPFPKNPNFYNKMHFYILIFPLAFFHLCSQRLGVVVGHLFYNVLWCLDFGVGFIS